MRIAAQSGIVGVVTLYLGYLVGRWEQRRRYEAERDAWRHRYLREQKNGRW